MRSTVSLLMVFVFTTLTPQAATYLIQPDGTGDFPTIQAGVDAVDDGDVLELGDGTFTGDGNRDIDYLGKAITLRSQSGNPEDCVIDCEGSAADPHRGFRFHSGEGSGSVLSDVMITGGWAADAERGGGIRCENASAPVISGCVLHHIHGGGALCIDGSHPSFSGCVFQQNHAVDGGGVCCEQAAATIQDCQFRDNQAESNGGGMYAIASEVALGGCVFEYNHASHGGASDFHFGCVVAVQDCQYYGNNGHEAGCLCLFGLCDGVIEDCTFAGNVGDTWGGALSVSKSSTCHVDRCTFYGNSSTIATVMLEDNHFTMSNTIIAFNLKAPGLYQYTDVELSCCDIFGNEGGDWIGSYASQYGVNGNISADPLFCDPATYDLTLDASSPCAPFSPPNPECDQIGAWSVGCGGTPVRESSWGRLKALFGDGGFSPRPASPAAP